MWGSMTITKKVLALLIASSLIASNAYPQATGGLPSVPASGLPAFSGDCTSTKGTASLTCTKTSGVAFATSATTNTTNATNITSGALPVAQLSNLFSKGAFASKPSASSGLMYYATDLGTAGVLLISNGTLWKPATGIATIYANAVNVSHTGDTNEDNQLNIAIPANIPNANGALRISCLFMASGTAGTKTYIFRLNTTSGATSGGQFLSTGALSASTLSDNVIRTIRNRNSVSSQVTEANAVSGPGNSGGVNVTNTLNTSSGTYYINVNTQAASSSDTLGIDGCDVQWIEP